MSLTDGYISERQCGEPVCAGRREAWQEARNSSALQKAINQRMARERVLTLLNA